MTAVICWICTGNDLLNLWKPCLRAVSGEAESNIREQMQLKITQDLGGVFVFLTNEISMFFFSFRKYQS